MRLALLLLPLLWLARLQAPARGKADRGAADGPTWLADVGEAFALAAESGRPLLIVFR